MTTFNYLKEMWRICVSISVTVILREEMLPKSTNRPLYYNINYCYQGRPPLKMLIFTLYRFSKRKDLYPSCPLQLAFRLISLPESLKLKLQILFERTVHALLGISKAYVKKQV